MTVDFSYWNMLQIASCYVISKLLTNLIVTFTQHHNGEFNSVHCICIAPYHSIIYLIVEVRRKRRERKGQQGTSTIKKWFIDSFDYMLYQKGNY